MIGLNDVMDKKILTKKDMTNAKKKKIKECALNKDQAQKLNYDRYLYELSNTSDDCFSFDSLAKAMEPTDFRLKKVSGSVNNVKTLFTLKPGRYLVQLTPNDGDGQWTPKEWRTRPVHIVGLVVAPRKEDSYFINGGEKLDFAPSTCEKYIRGKRILKIRQVVGK